MTSPKDDINPKDDQPHKTKTGREREIIKNKKTNADTAQESTRNKKYQKQRKNQNIQYRRDTQEVDKESAVLLASKWTHACARLARVRLIVLRYRREIGEQLKFYETNGSMASLAQ